MSILSKRISDELRGEIEKFEKEAGKSIYEFYGYDWEYFPAVIKMSEELIIHLEDNIHWGVVASNQTLSLEFIERYKDKLSWRALIVTKKFDEEFLLKYRDRIDPVYLTIFQNVGESFAVRYPDMVDWYEISSRWNLTYQFIIDNLERLNLSKIIKEKNYEKMDINQINDLESMHLFLMEFQSIEKEN